jgi:hypothetical protein
MVALSEAIPMAVVHDLEELDVDHTHVKENGIAGSTADTQQIATNIAQNRCITDAKVAKVSQVVNGNRQKYQLEFELKCPEDVGTKKKPKPSAAAPAEDKP